MSEPVDSFDPRRAILRGPDMFKRLRLERAPSPLTELRLPDDDELLFFDRGGCRYALLVHQMAYHHVAEGDVDGEATLIAFCGVCHSGMRFSPFIDGELHHFSAGGLYDGIVLLIDDETHSHWNHMTGECVRGPLKGKALRAYSVDMTTVAAEKTRDGDTRLWLGKPAPIWRFFLGRYGMRHRIRSRGFLPPFFHGTMRKNDPRLHRMDQGLGVVIAGKAKFYPVKSLSKPVDDRLAGSLLSLRLREEDRVPTATDESGERPMQLFCRWYGFSGTYPGCEVYGQGS